METGDNNDGAVSALVGRNVSVRRRAMGFSASYVAESVSAAGVPLSRSALSQVENGKRRVTVDELVAIAGVLVCPPSALLSQEPPYPGSNTPGRPSNIRVFSPPPVRIDLPFSPVVDRHDLPKVPFKPALSTHDVVEKADGDAAHAVEEGVALSKESLAEVARIARDTAREEFARLVREMAEAGFRDPERAAAHELAAKHFQQFGAPWEAPVDDAEDADG